MTQVKAPVQNNIPHNRNQEEPTSTISIQREELFQEMRNKHCEDLDAMQAINLAESILLKAGTAANDPRTFIGIPHFGDVNFLTAKACLLECSDKVHLKTLNDWTSSLLCWAFNHLWCDALNARSHDNIGQKFNYWLLCHADISFRTHHWLDVLTDDMEKYGYDVLHVPMAIKDGRGLTSTALGNGDNKYGHVRRITTTELQKLPPVFGLDDVVELMKKSGPVPKNPVFCPNTGVMLIKMNPSWIWEFPGFNIMDKLVTEVHPSGKIFRQPLVLSEDWHSGYWFQQRGLKVGGCRRVRTDHWSRASFANDKPWGEERDEGYMSDPMHW